jgi:hypothetical protein
MGKLGYNQVNDNIDSRNNDFGSDKNDDDPFLSSISNVNIMNTTSAYKNLTMSSRSLLSQYSE